MLYNVHVLRVMYKLLADRQLRARGDCQMLLGVCASVVRGLMARLRGDVAGEWSRGGIGGLRSRRQGEERTGAVRGRGAVRGGKGRDIVGRVGKRKAKERMWGWGCGLIGWVKELETTGVKCYCRNPLPSVQHCMESLAGKH